MIDWGTKCQGDTFIPQNIAHIAITLLYNNINYWLGMKKVIHLGAQGTQLDIKELFLLRTLSSSFCILISGCSAASCLLLCVVIYYIGAKYSLDCPVVTLHLSGSLPGLNKSHMQILMVVFRPFISHPVAGRKGKGWRLFRETCFQAQKKRF